MITHFEVDKKEISDRNKTDQQLINRTYTNGEVNDNQTDRKASLQSNTEKPPFLNGKNDLMGRRPSFTDDMKFMGRSRDEFVLKLLASRSDESDVDNNAHEKDSDWDDIRKESEDEYESSNDQSIQESITQNPLSIDISNEQLENNIFPIVSAPLNDYSTNNTPDQPIDLKKDKKNRELLEKSKTNPLFALFSEYLDRRDHKISQLKDQIRTDELESRQEIQLLQTELKNIHAEIEKEKKKTDIIKSSPYYKSYKQAHAMTLLQQNILGINSTSQDDGSTNRVVSRANDRLHKRTLELVVKHTASKMALQAIQEEVAFYKSIAENANRERSFEQRAMQTAASAQLDSITKLADMEDEKNALVPQLIDVKAKLANYFYEFDIEHRKNVTGLYKLQQFAQRLGRLELLVHSDRKELLSSQRAMKRKASKAKMLPGGSAKIGFPSTSQKSLNSLKSTSSLASTTHDDATLDNGNLQIENDIRDIFDDSFANRHSLLEMLESIKERRQFSQKGIKIDDLYDEIPLDNLTDVSDMAYTKGLRLKKKKKRDLDASEDSSSGSEYTLVYDLDGSDEDLNNISFEELSNPSISSDNESEYSSTSDDFDPNNTSSAKKKKRSGPSTLEKNALKLIQGEQSRKSDGRIKSLDVDDDLKRSPSGELDASNGSIPQTIDEPKPISKDEEPTRGRSKSTFSGWAKRIGSFTGFLSTSKSNETIEDKTESSTKDASKEGGENFLINNPQLLRPTSEETIDENKSHQSKNSDVGKVIHIQSQLEAASNTLSNGSSDHPIKSLHSNSSDSGVNLPRSTPKSFSGKSIQNFFTKPFSKEIKSMTPKHDTDSGEVNSSSTPTITIQNVMTSPFVWGRSTVRSKSPVNIDLLMDPSGNDQNKTALPTGTSHDNNLPTIPQSKSFGLASINSQSSTVILFNQVYDDRYSLRSDMSRSSANISFSKVYPPSPSNLAMEDYEAMIAKSLTTSSDIQDHDKSIDEIFNDPDLIHHQVLGKYSRMINLGMSKEVVLHFMKSDQIPETAVPGMYRDFKTSGGMNKSNASENESIYRMKTIHEVDHPSEMTPPSDSHGPTTATTEGKGGSDVPSKFFNNLHDNDFQSNRMKETIRFHNSFKPTRLVPSLRRSASDNGKRRNPLFPKKNHLVSNNELDEKNHHSSSSMNNPLSLLALPTSTSKDRIGDEVSNLDQSPHSIQTAPNTPYVKASGPTIDIFRSSSSDDIMMKSAIQKKKLHWNGLDSKKVHKDSLWAEDETSASVHESTSHILLDQEEFSKLFVTTKPKPDKRAVFATVSSKGPSPQMLKDLHKQISASLHKKNLMKSSSADDAEGNLPMQRLVRQRAVVKPTHDQTDEQQPDEVSMNPDETENLEETFEQSGNEIDENLFVERDGKVLLRMSQRRVESMRKQRSDERERKLLQDGMMDRNSMDPPQEEDSMISTELDGGFLSTALPPLPPHPSQPQPIEEETVSQPRESLYSNADDIKGEEGDTAPKTKKEEQMVELKDHPKFAKYFKMLKMGIMIEAVRQKMIQDEVDPSYIDRDPHELILLALRSESDEKVPVSEHPTYAKYFKMLKIGLNKEQVKQKMIMEGIDPSFLDKDPSELVPLLEKLPVGLKTGIKKNAVEKGGMTRSSVRKKRLHWNGIDSSRLKEDSLWADMGNDDDTSEILLDEEEFKQLFVQEEMINNKNSVAKRLFKPVMAKAVVNVIDSKRAWNGDIVLARIKTPFEELKRQFLCFSDDNLHSDQLKSLLMYLPTPEDRKVLVAYKGDIEALGRCERYMMVMMNFPTAAKRINCMTFRHQFKGRIHECRSKLLVIDHACHDVRSSSRLKKVLKTILKVGNQFNDGEEEHKGFTLDSLLKLQNAKAFDKKTSILQYIVTLISRHDTDCLRFPHDLPHVDEASRITFEIIQHEIKILHEELNMHLHFVEGLQNETVDLAEKSNQMLESLKKAQGFCKDLENQYENVRLKFSNILTYFGEDENTTPEHFFSLFHQFIQQFVTTRNYVEKMKKEEQKNGIRR